MSSSSRAVRSDEVDLRGETRRGEEPLDTSGTDGRPARNTSRSGWRRVVGLLPWMMGR